MNIATDTAVTDQDVVDNGTAAESETIPANVEHIVVDEHNIQRQATLTEQADPAQKEAEELQALARKLLTHPATKPLFDLHAIRLMQGLLLQYGLVQPAPAPNENNLIVELLGEGSDEANMLVSRNAGEDPLSPSAYETQFRSGPEHAYTDARLDVGMAAAINEMFVANDLQDNTQYHVRIGMRVDAPTAAHNNH